ncbi:NAD(P)H-binding protein [Arthrobacter sp. efr-133-TYG-104]|uniref:SDR family oxidoreductase n=1 Tax=Arthrobacter sp. efr-133-TYG-104 TaxID=3040324 RepID=UPI00254A384A|nr:NAD(P)H-binding protein [Arthrobacter sp. efr-133-TYG-104]
MATICVAGGTGQVGREVVRMAVAAGQTVSVLARHVPASGSAQHHDGVTYFAGDVTTGEGLDAALGGADVVIDCLEAQFGKAQKQFADGGRRLLSAAHRAGVTRAVMLSIVNCDRTTYPYYASKARKEGVYAQASLETVVVRATQFHSLVAAIFQSGAKLRLIPVFRGAKFQSISPNDVARGLLESAFAGPDTEQHSVRTLGGPEVQSMRQMAEQWREITGRGGRIVELPLPGRLGDFLRAGHNLSPGEWRGTETFVSWLEMRRETL